MSAISTIQHTGYIESISEEGVRVKFTSLSACADCHAKGVCSASDMKEKEVTIQNPAETYKIGESVDVVMTSDQGSRAVLIGYVYPFILFLICLLVLSAAGLNEVQSGLISLLILIPYYLSIYLLRNRISQKFKFSVRKQG